MNTMKLIKNFSVQKLEKTIANLVNINGTEIIIHYCAFDEDHRLIDSKRYAVNAKPYRKFFPDEEKCSSVNKAVDKILAAHPDACIHSVEFDIYMEKVEVSFYEHK